MNVRVELLQAITAGLAIFILICALGMYLYLRHANKRDAEFTTSLPSLQHEEDQKKEEIVDKPRFSFTEAAIPQEAEETTEKKPRFKTRREIKKESVKNKTTVFADAEDDGEDW